MSSSVPAVTRALTLLLRDLFPEAGISYGPPTNYPDSMAAVVGARAEGVEPTTGGATRSRDETVYSTIKLSVFEPGPTGDTSAEQIDDNPAVVATAGAYAMYDALEDHFRDITVPTLSGLVREAIITDHELELIASTDTKNVVTGRIAEITATVRTVTRI